MIRSQWWKKLHINRGHQRSERGKRSCKPVVEPLEERCQPSVTGFRPIDGVGNNVGNPALGASNTQLLRLSPAAYKPVANGGDGLNTPSLTYGAPTFIAGPRLVSNDVSNQATTLFGSEDFNTINSNGLSDFGYTWGQFLDHDFDLTPDQGSAAQPPPPNTNKDGANGFPIPVDPTHPGDPIGSLAFTRSIFDPTTGVTTPRKQMNVSTSFMDLSQVYGSTGFVADALRTMSGGKLKSSPGADGIIGTQDDLLPYNSLTYFNASQIAALGMANDAHLVTNDQLFAAGDPRANETIELTSLQTLFMRNHNLLATQLHFIYPSWNDEQLYQEARKINIAQVQFITYTQYLPDLLGPNALPNYTGYKSNVNPAISTEFSTVAYRFGHSLLNNTVDRHGNDGLDVADPTGSSAVPLAANFFNPTLLSPGGVIDPLTGHVSTDIGAVLKGDADGMSQEMDVYAVSSIRNLLFGQGGPGEDLIARDIWRADDHGIGTYNDVRIAFGLAPISNDATHGFGQITSDPVVQANLITAFTGPTRENFLANGKFAGDINPFVAGMAEAHVPGSNLGPLFHNILVDQFTRMRDGDRFFFLNQDWTPVELLLGAQGITLGSVIRANTDVTNLQLDVFKFSASIGGTVALGPGTSHGVAGVTVELRDSDGNVVATTVTDSHGRYNFTQFSVGAFDPTLQSGVSHTGTYTVDIIVPPGYEQTSDDPDPILISSGSTKVKHIDFFLDLT